MCYLLKSLVFNLAGFVWEEERREKDSFLLDRTGR